MATTKKSTKAKAKTTKRPAAKATAARAAKASKKTVTTKAVKTPAKNAAATTTPPNTLLIISAVLSVLGAGLAGYFMKDVSYQLVSNLMAKNELAGANAAGYVQAIRHVFDLNLRWAVVAILSLSAVFPFLFLTVYKERFNNALKTKVNSLRWVEVGIIGALMTETVALLSGINNLTTLKLMGLLVAVSAALAWVTEKRAVQAKRVVKSELWLAAVTGALPWLAIACTAINTVIFGNLTAPWYVYALYAVLLPGAVGYFSTLRSMIKGNLNTQAAEKNYIGLGILIKVAFVAILIAGSYVN